MSRKNAPVASLIAAYISNPQPYSNYLHNLVALAVQLQNLKEDRWTLGEELCEHYVYVYLDTRKPGRYEYTCPSGKVARFKFQPFYVGKGKGDRADVHLEEAKRFKDVPGNHGHKINTILAIQNETGRDPLRKRTGSVSTEWMSFALEIDLIAGIGRHNLKKGPLTNGTNGGDGASGVIQSEEWRRKNSEANKGKPKHGRMVKGHRKTADECRKNSEAQQRNNAIRDALPDIECDVCGKKGRLLLNHFTNCRGPKFINVPDLRMRYENRHMLPSVHCPHCNTECRGPKFIEHFGNCPHKP